MHSTKNIMVTSKHRQSYRHADPCRQHPQLAQQCIGMRNTGHNHWQLCDRVGFCNPVLNLWPFDLWVNACRETAIEYTCTKFGVDSSSRFPVWAETNRQTRLNAPPTPVAMLACVMIHFIFAQYIKYRMQIMQQHSEYQFLQQMTSMLRRWQNVYS